VHLRLQNGAFAVIETDGSITAWGYSLDGGMNAPSTGVYTKIYSFGLHLQYLQD
jgi:hypothetical protein